MLFFDCVERLMNQGCKLSLPTHKKAIAMEKLVCTDCGTVFNCGAAPGKNRCWCMDLPNLRQNFDLAGTCICPDCMTLGKAKQMIKLRKLRQQQRAASSLRSR